MSACRLAGSGFVWLRTAGAALAVLRVVVCEGPAACLFFNISTSKSALNPSVFQTFDFEMCFAPELRALFRHLNFQKCSEPGKFCTLLTSKNASGHDGVHFFDISTSKSGPNMWCFVYFDLEMCFAPQRRALSRHLFQMCSEHVVLCTF